MLTNQEHAARYYTPDLHVLPLARLLPDGSCSCSNPGCASPGRHPIDPSHIATASNSQSVVRTTWTDPRANIGVATGRKTLVKALRVSGERGERSLRAALEGIDEEMTPTVEVLNNDGRTIVFFSHTDELDHDCPPVETGEILPGLEVLDEGGYFVAPPSEDAAGIYRWRDDRRPTPDHVPVDPHIVHKIVDWSKKNYGKVAGLVRYLPKTKLIY